MKSVILVFFFCGFCLLSISQVYTPQIDSIAMRDGKKLAADVYIVSGGLQKPTIF